jgi:PIN domain nuclease of toxin-antitoxin system
MKCLLDTHTFLWFVDDSPGLPVNVKSIIRDPANDVRVSIVSFWEIGIKASIGKLALATSLLGLEAIANDQSIEIVPMTVQAISHSQFLPYHHKDPFDRMIAATAITEGDILLSVDAIFDAYGVSRTW